MPASLFMADHVPGFLGFRGGAATGDWRFIVPFTALGGPIVSVPVGFDNGLPLGLMIIGSPGSDGPIAELADRLAAAIEMPR